MNFYEVLIAEKVNEFIKDYEKRMGNNGTD